MTRPAFTLAGRMRSFGYAFNGLGFMLRTQHNAWLHLVATVVVVAVGFALKVEADAWAWLVVAIAMVWVAETMNTAFEHVCDVISPELHQSVKRAKDVAAGAVLLAAIAAVIIGALTLWPYVNG
jgi:diacylglycerol kinase (ATP)